MFLVPFMMLGGVLQAAHESRGFAEDTAKNADRLASDAIANYKTIQSFGCDEEIVEEFVALLAPSVDMDVKAGYKFGLYFGLSQVLTNGVFVTIYQVMSYLMVNFSETSPLCWPEPMFIAMYTIVYGGMQAAQAN
jgi:hypothetical protein